MSKEKNEISRFNFSLLHFWFRNYIDALWAYVHVRFCTLYLSVRGFVWNVYARASMRGWLHRRGMRGEAAIAREAPDHDITTNIFLLFRLTVLPFRCHSNYQYYTTTVCFILFFNILFCFVGIIFYWGLWNLLLFSLFYILLSGLQN